MSEFYQLQQWKYIVKIGQSSIISNDENVIIFLSLLVSGVVSEALD